MTVDVLAPYLRPAELPLDIQELQVWYVDLAFSEDRLARAREWLNADEQGRAARFVRPRLGARFTAARAALRGLLGVALAVNPKEVRFDYGVRGKPSLAADLASSGLRFNLSHSEDGA